ncbi:MAG: MlaD family protein [Neisseria sp.]|nr:MlaD family protein [Neisseria sp.]
MNEKHMQQEKILPASKRATSIVSVVWLIPLLALFAGIWLLVGTIRDAGPEITLLMPDAEGMQAGTTVIKFLDVEVGRITDIALNEEQNGVVMRARMNASAEKMLRDDTLFWVVKPRIDQSGITGLRTLVSGLYLEMAPGKSEQKADVFTVGNEPPPNSSREAGIHVRLLGQTDRVLAAGSPVLYRNIEVGWVEKARFNAESSATEYEVFIASPNDHLIGNNTRFWLIGGINLGMEAGKINLSAPPVGALLSGAIVFDDPRDGDRGAKPSDDVLFTLYPNEDAVPAVPDQDAVYRVAFFEQSIRALPQGAQVIYRGVTVGEVAATPYFVAGDRARLLENRHVPVLFYLDPHFFREEGAELDIAAWQKTLDQVLDKELNASLISDNILTGSLLIELSDAPQGTPTYKPVAQYGDYRVIATRRGGMDGLLQQFNDVLARLNNLPLDKTVTELNKTLGSLNKLLDSQETQALPQDLRQTLEALQAALKGISPDAPAYRDAQNTLRRLDDALRRAEPVLKTLNEKPNALIFNHNAPDPVPKGRP